MIKYLCIYILIQLFSYVVLAVGTLGMLANNWFRSLKKGRAIELGDYADLVIDNMKKAINKNKEDINKMRFIPCKRAINIYKILHNSMKETLSSDEFLKKSHIMSEMEKMKVKSVKERNKFNIINRVTETEEALINPLEYDTIVKKVDDTKSYYAFAGEYSSDEVEYISFVTKMKPTYGQISGFRYVILDAVDLEEIHELFPSFQTIETDYDIPQIDIKVICLHKPDEANISYAITNIMLKRVMPKEIIDSEIKLVEEDSVKLTK